MNDVDLSLRGLRRVVAAIAEAQGERKLAHVLALARLLRSDRVLNSAVQDLGRLEVNGDAARLDRIATELRTSAEHYMLELALEHQRSTDGAEAWRAIVEGNPGLIAKASTGETLPNLLHRTRMTGSERQRADLTTKDIVLFANEVVPRLQTQIASAGNPAVLRSASVMLKTLKDIGDKCSRLIKFQALCNAGSVAKIAARLEGLRADWELRLEQGPAGERWIVPDSMGLEHDASTIASRIETFLEGRRSQRLVLYRAKVFFEHFFHLEARAALTAEEARVHAAVASGRGAQAQRELVLRRHLDRFIFQEGFFPITEASASRGQLDLLIADADAAGIRPLVAELKQAARIAPDDVGIDDVRAAVEAARAEIPRYAGHLRARSGWDSVEPIVVVFHTAIEDVSSLEDDATILIDIGTRTPSRVRVVREEEGDDDEDE